MSLGRDAILAKKDAVKREEVDLGDGETVWIQGMRGDQWDEYQAALVPNGTGKPNMRNASAKLVQLTATDADGVPLFQPSDVDQIGEIPAEIMSRMTGVAFRLSGVLSTEKAAKNS